MSLERQNCRGSRRRYNWRKAAPTCRNGLAAEVPPGSESRACTHRGSPGTWEILSSPSLWRPGGTPGHQMPRPTSAALAAGGSETTSAAWYRRAKATKRGGKGGRESEHLRSTGEAGEPAPGTRWREGDAGTRNRWRERCQGTPSPESVSTKLQRIAELARTAPQMAFTTLAHHIDLDWLRGSLPSHPQGRSAWAWTGRRRTSTRANLEANLRVAARPLQVRHVPGAAGATGAHPEGRTGKTRPIGIPTFEDKVLQRAVAMVLEADLRAGLSGLLVRLPAGPLGAPGAGGAVAGTDGRWAAAG